MGERDGDHTIMNLGDEEGGEGWLIMIFGKNGEGRKKPGGEGGTVAPQRGGHAVHRCRWRKEVLGESGWRIGRQGKEIEGGEKNEKGKE